MFWCEVEKRWCSIWCCDREECEWENQDSEGEELVKVIKYGQKRRATCENCGAILEYEKDDIKTIQIGMNEYGQHIVCPACNENVEVD